MQNFDLFDQGCACGIRFEDDAKRLIATLALQAQHGGALILAGLQTGAPYSAGLALGVDGKNLNVAVLVAAQANLKLAIAGQGKLLGVVPGVAFQQDGGVQLKGWLRGGGGGHVEWVGGRSLAGVWAWP